MRDPFSVAEPYLKAERPAGRIAAIEICSTVLQAHIWFALEDSFDSPDDLAVFYPHELEFLKDKDPQTLCEIHQVKLAFPGSKVRQ